LNRKVRISSAEGEMMGMAADLDFEGALILELEGGGRSRILAGDCIHLRPCLHSEEA